MNLDATCTHAQFGELVGISRQAVGDLLAREVITPGETAREWLLCYCENLRKQAAGWGDGRVAYERAETLRVSRERNEIKLAKDRNEFTSVTNVSIVLAHVGGVIAGRLEALPDTLQKRCPEITPEGKKIMQMEVAAACNEAVRASLDSLAVLDEEIEAVEESAEPDSAEQDAEAILFEDGGT